MGSVEDFSKVPGVVRQGILEAAYLVLQIKQHLLEWQRTLRLGFPCFADI